MKKLSYLLILMALFALGLASACAEAKPAGLSDEQLNSVADNVLKALDANAYDQFTPYASDQMNAAFTPEQFSQSHEMLLKASGHYQSVGKPTLTNNQGYAVYRFPAKFDNETVYITLTFKVGGDKVEGFWMDSTNLRGQPK